MPVTQSMREYPSTERCLGGVTDFNDAPRWIYDLDNPYLHGVYAPTLDEMSVEEMEAMLSMSAPKPKAKKQRSREDDELGALVAESLREAQSDAE